jgi:hypothetical protein
MTIFPLDMTRFSELVTASLLRWKRGELGNVSDRSLEDIGLEPPRRDLDAVKPFWER